MLNTSSKPSLKPSPKPSREIYWHPRYWPNWLIIALFRVTTVLPFDWQISIGSVIGKIAYKVAGKRRHIAETNIRLCFPDLSEPEQQELVKNIFINNGIGIIETSFAWNGNLRDIEGRFEFDGLENLQAAVEANQGVLLLGMHFSTLDLCGAALSQKVPFHVMYRKNKNALVEKTMGDGRRRNFPAAIERADIRSVIKTLKAHEVVWYGPDQDYGGKQSVFAPFFNIEAASITATARIAKMTDAKVVPFRHYRTANNQYKIELLPALENFPVGDEVADAARINQLVEQAVKNAPAQYWWVHRRFKTRPNGEERPY